MRLAPLLAPLAAAVLVAAPLAPAASAAENGCTVIAPGGWYCEYRTTTGTARFTYAGAGGYSLSVTRNGSTSGWTETDTVDAYKVKVATMHMQPGDRVTVMAYAGPAGTYTVVDIQDVE